MKSSLVRILELQEEELWGERKTPEEEDGFLCSQMDMDIWTVPPCSRMTHICSFCQMYSHSWVHHC